MAFFNHPASARLPSTAQQYLASALYVFASYASLVLVAIPGLLALLWQGTLSGNVVAAFVGMTSLMGLLYGLWRGMQHSERWVEKLNRYVPALGAVLAEMRRQPVRRGSLFRIVALSLGVELCGVVHLWIAARALGYPAGFELALVGYTVATMFYAVSPFMRGLGLVELSLTYVLVQYGIPKVPAVSVALYYRFFEFWFHLLL